MHADCHIPSRLFRRRGGDEHSTEPARVPHWHVVAQLPTGLSQIIAKVVSSSNANNAAAKGAAKHTKGGTGSRAAKAKGGKTDRSRSRGRGRGRAAEDDVREGGGRESDEASVDGAQSDDDSDFEHGGAARGPSVSKPAKKGGKSAKGRAPSAVGASGKDAKKLGVRGASTPSKRQATLRGAGQQTLLSPFGAQRVPDATSPAKCGLKRVRQPEAPAEDASGAAPNPLSEFLNSTFHGILV